jgi:hypothetical protein
MSSSAPSVLANTECDTDPNAVDFTATVDAGLINLLLSGVGNLQVDVSAGIPIQFQGLCVTHQILARAGVATIPVGASPVTVTPSPGRLEVEVKVPTELSVGIDGDTHTTFNCDSTCVFNVPYLGEIVNVCDLEEGIVGPIVGTLEAGATLGEVTITQVADTCVRGDCTAIHPLETSNAEIGNFDVDLISGGSCDVCELLPDTFDFLCFPFGGSLDPCAALDGLIEDALQPALENAIADALVVDGKGLLIEVFHSEIVADFFGCNPISEVQQCLAQQPGTADDLGPRNRSLNALLYLLPLALAAGMVFRIRRRSS